MRNERIFQICNPRPTAEIQRELILIVSLSELFDEHKQVYEFPLNGFESCIMFDLTPEQIKVIQDELGDVIINELFYSIQEIV